MIVIYSSTIESVLLKFKILWKSIYDHITIARVTLTLTCQKIPKSLSDKPCSMAAKFHRLGTQQNTML